ncbi:hypothetical protein QUF49_10845 [Fictibacillus sp. b24]|uniref:hypothetical protein n=1 Tax=Fictibacillus sp. b24 TaxID=3055863 RepID=UPI0025A0A9D5|nr:hypothetical protein [Fictibacillus sp. b24]MDM5316490.1 hypothetical protein [Fictibacillus sp. b24]
MRDSCGTGGQVRHLRVKRLNVAHRLPRGKRAAWNGNHLLPKATSFAKTAKWKEEAPLVQEVPFSLYFYDNLEKSM